MENKSTFVYSLLKKLAEIEGDGYNSGFGIFWPHRSNDTHELMLCDLGILKYVGTASCLRRRGIDTVFNCNRGIYEVDMQRLAELKKAISPLPAYNLFDSTQFVPATG